MLYNINLTERCNLNCKHCFAPKSSHNMSEKVIEETIDFVSKRLLIDDKHNFNKSVEFMGGEVGLLDPKIISNIIDRINDNTGFNDITYRLRTNLIYDLTDEHIKLFKKVNFFGTSYDYGIRFNNKEQEDLWYKNIEIIKSHNIPIDCSFCITKTLITTVEPQEFIDFIIKLNLNTYNLMQLSIPTNQTSDYDRPNNREMDEWLYKVFLIYEDYNKHNNKLFIELFECIRDATNGKNYSDFQRNCQRVNMTIDPLGNVSQCLFTQHKPYYNLITKKLNYKIYNDWVNYEQTLKEECQQCHLLKYCKGTCCLCEWDDSGCPSQKLIFNHILGVKNE